MFVNSFLLLRSTCLIYKIYFSDIQAFSCEKRNRKITVVVLTLIDDDLKCFRWFLLISENSESRYNIFLNVIYR